MLNTSQRLVNKNSSSWWYVLKTSWRHLCKMSTKRLEEVLKMYWRRWRRLEYVWPGRIYWSWPRRPEDVLKASSEDVWLRRIYSSWSRRLEDVFWRRRRKTSSRRLYQDECLLAFCWFLLKAIINWEYPHILAQETVDEDLRKLKMFMNIVNFSLIIFKPKMFRYPETSTT